PLRVFITTGVVVVLALVHSVGAARELPVSIPGSRPSRGVSLSGSYNGRRVTAATGIRRRRVQVTGSAECSPLNPCLCRVSPINHDAETVFGDISSCHFGNGRAGYASKRGGDWHKRALPSKG